MVFRFHHRTKFAVLLEVVETSYDELAVLLETNYCTMSFRRLPPLETVSFQSSLST
jgi:hypothetical protein